MATLLRADGTRQAVAPARGRAFSPVELYGFVGGHIELVGERGPTLAFCNADGRRLGLAANREASRLLAPWLRPGEQIVGDVLLCSLVEAGEPAEGEIES